MKDAGGKDQIEPQEPGCYLWYILDYGYFEVGYVNVIKDTAEHLAYLRESSRESTKKGSYIYENEVGETLTMYHGASSGQTPHLPPLDNSGRPMVDLYVTFDMKNLPIREHPITPQMLPTREELEERKKYNS